jgi:hypothetical protein
MQPYVCPLRCSLSREPLSVSTRILYHIHATSMSPPLSSSPLACPLASAVCGYTVRGGEGKGQQGMGRRGRQSGREGAGGWMEQGSRALALTKLAAGFHVRRTAPPEEPERSFLLKGREGRRAEGGEIGENERVVRGGREASSSSSRSSSSGPRMLGRLWQCWFRSRANTVFPPTLCIADAGCDALHLVCVCVCVCVCVSVFHAPFEVCGCLCVFCTPSLSLSASLSLPLSRPPLCASMCACVPCPRPFPPPSPSLSAWVRQVEGGPRGSRPDRQVRQYQKRPIRVSKETY